MDTIKAEKILIVDFGGQYNQLIARRIRDLNIYSDIVPYKAALDYALNLSALFLQAGRTAFTKRMPRCRIQRFLIWVFRCSAFAMECKLLPAA